MTRILILGAAEVQADAVISAKNQGAEVHVCAADSGPAMAYADAAARFSFSEIDRLADYATSNNIDLVYSVGSDLAMPVVGWIGEHLNTPHFVGHEVASICNNKIRMRSHLAQRHFTGNAWFEAVALGSSFRRPRGPVIVKPADSQGQRGITRVDDGDVEAAIAAAQSVSRTQTAIVEEWLEGPEVSVNGYLIDGHPVLSVASDRHVWSEHVGLVSGHTMPPATISEQESSEVSIMVGEAAKLLGIENGPVYAQVKVTQSGPKLIEISPRLDGCHLWKLIHECYGVDILDAIWSHLLGHETPVFPEPSPSGRFSIDFICAPPESVADYERNRKDIVRYYQPGDIIRPINGHLEKIGYHLGPTTT